MIVPITVNKFDPNSATSSPVRPLASVLQSGSVTFDVDYPESGRWLYVGTSGSISYTKYDGTIETLPVLVPGVFHYIASIRVNSSGTSIAEDQIRWGS
jgi:hypothetical protein